MVDDASELDPATVAAELRHAELTATPVELLTARWPALTWVDARAVARERDRLRHDDGDAPIGYKLGWTSAAMREALGIDRPNWGTLWRSQLVDDAHVELGELIHPKVEPELVFRCTADVSADATVEEIAANGAWALGLELVDPRFPSFEFDWLDNTADNSSAARVVVGEFHRLAVPPAELSVEMTDGNARRNGLGSAAMDDPCAAVAWLGRSLAEVPAGLRAGDIVFTGGITAPFDVRAGETYEARCEELGAVAFRASDD